MAITVVTVPFSVTFTFTVTVTFTVTIRYRLPRPLAMGRRKTPGRWKSAWLPSEATADASSELRPTAAGHRPVCLWP